MNTRALAIWLALLCASTASLVVGVTWAWGQYLAAGGRPIVIGSILAGNDDALADAMLKLHPEYRSLNASSFEPILQAAVLLSAHGQICAGLWPEFQPGARVMRRLADTTFAVGDRLKLTTEAQHRMAEQLPQVMQNQLD